VQSALRNFSVGKSESALYVNQAKLGHHQPNTLRGGIVQFKPSLPIHPVMSSNAANAALPVVVQFMLSVWYTPSIPYPLKTEGKSNSRQASQILKPNPSIQLLYCSIVDWQSFCGSAALENNMQSSRFAFSSLQTQQGCIPLSVNCRVYARRAIATHLWPRSSVGALGNSRGRGGDLSKGGYLYRHQSAPTLTISYPPEATHKLKLIGMPWLDRAGRKLSLLGRQD